MIELIKFQRKAVNELKIRSNNKKDSLLVAPTGSGKTVMLSSYINEMINHPVYDFCFVWISPAKGDLHLQSKKKMESFFPEIETFTLEEASKQGNFKKNSTTFISWESVAKDKNKIHSETENYNFTDIIQNTNSKIILLIDEEHANKTFKAKNVISLIRPFITIEATATPKNKSINSIEILKNEVINSGLIRKNFVINDGIKSQEITASEVALLLNHAIKKQEELRILYKKEKKELNPLIIVQLPNKNEDIKNEVLDFLEQKGISVKDNNLSIWLNNHYENIEDEKILPFNSPISVVITKQAINMGWDAPRAQILVKLRDSKSATFSLQTLGRINRMPERKHYSLEDLNDAYVYTIDKEYTNAILEGEESVVHKRISFIKNEFKTEINKIKLPIVKASKDRVSGIKTDQLASELSKFLKNNIGSTKLAFKNKGFIFSQSVELDILKGFVDNDLEEVSLLEDIKVIVSANRKKLDYMYKSSILKISQHMDVNYKSAVLIMDKLFDGRLYKPLIFNFEKRLEYYYFIINNEKSFNQILSEFYKTNDRITSDLIMDDQATDWWTIPNSHTAKANKEEKFDKPNFLAKKGVYEIQMLKEIKEYATEVLFSNFIDKSNLFNWWYKNGDSGMANFSVTYRKASMGKVKNFFPDYIAEDINKTIWFIEAKGEKNSDESAADKLNALKQYQKAVGIKVSFGFVRVFEKKLYLTNEKFVEEFNSKTWIQIDDFFKKKIKTTK